MIGPADHCGAGNPSDPKPALFYEALKDQVGYRDEARCAHVAAEGGQLADHQPSDLPSIRMVGQHGEAADLPHAGRSWRRAAEKVRERALKEIRLLRAERTPVADHPAGLERSAVLSRAVERVELKKINGRHLPAEGLPEHAMAQAPGLGNQLWRVGCPKSYYRDGMQRTHSPVFTRELVIRQHTEVAGQMTGEMNESEKTVEAGIQELEDALNGIAGCQSVDELHAFMARVVEALGFACHTYMDVRQLPISDEPVPFHVTTVPEAFVEAYVSENLLGYDPVIRRAASTNAAFTWSDCPEFNLSARPRRGLKSRALQVMQLADDFGYTQGFVLPTHAVDSQGRPASALFSLYWRDRLNAFDPQKSAPIWLRLAAASCHERMLELRGVSSGQSAPPILTDRERECLVWACRGKTRSETADILGIGDRTVEFHFANAMKKLGVYNKFHAIAVAIHLGLITP